MSWNGNSNGSGSKKSSGKSGKSKKSNKSRDLKNLAYDVGIVMNAKSGTQIADSLNAGKQRAVSGKSEKKPLF